MASPEGSKKGSSSGGQQQQQQRRRSHGNGNNESSPQSQNQLSLRAPVIRHRDPKAPVVISGWLFKQGSDGLMLWKKRWFALSQYCLFYYDGPEEEKVLGSLLLPGYTIRPCLAGDRDRFVYRKYAFKAEHRNTRSFYLAAESRPSMIQWMNALSLAAILQDSNSLSATNNTNTSELSRSQLDVSSISNGSSRRSSKAVLEASFDSTAQQPTGQRQPLYANAPPKPRRALNTSRDSHCSSSPDRSPERPPAAQSATRTPAPSSGMYANQVAVPQMRAHLNGRNWATQRPVSAEVTTLLQQQLRHRNSPQQMPAERRTPDAYGRFKTEYEDVYNNSTTSSGSSQMLQPAPSPAGFVVAHRSEVARRVPPRPHSVDFLQHPVIIPQQQQQQLQQQQQPPSDYWSSEQKYAQQVRQSVMRNYPGPTESGKESGEQQQRRIVRDPAEISRDVKESALWSYVQAHRPPTMKALSTSQENLIEESSAGSQAQLFHRSASARLPRMAKQQPDLLNSSLADQPVSPEMDNKRLEQREESMKRLLEWKQRMLQSPLTRKGGNNSVVSGGSGARSSERSTPTLADRDTSSSPRMPIDSPIQPSGSSPVQAVAAGLNHATTGAAGKAINGIKVAYHQSGLTGKVSSTLVTTQQPTANHFSSAEIYHSDTDMPPKKGKLPPMIGHDQPPSNNVGRAGDNKVQLSAGDLLGRTHEELVLLLIQLRRQSSALVKARDACLLEMESQVKLAALDISHRQECLTRTGELKHHVKELEKQLEKLKPMISLVDNMVKLGSSMSPQRQKRVMTKVPETNTAVKRNLTPLLHQQQQQQQPKFFPSSSYESPTYTNLQQRNNTMMFHSTPQRASEQRGIDVYGQNVQGWEEAQISQLESKHHQLAQLEKFVREEGAAIQRLTRNQQVLRMAIRGIRQQTNTALQNGDYGEVERCRQQQLFLERELSQIHSLLALSSKRLEDAAVEISRIEREISTLHQQLHRANSRLHQAAAGSGNHSLNRSNNGREMVWLEAELSRVQQHVSQLQTRRQELSAQVNCLTSADYFLDLDESFNNATNGTTKRKPLSTWCETDMDSLNTVDRQIRTEEPPSSSYAMGSRHPAYQQQQQQQQQHYPYEYDDGMMPVDINEADERMKRYYGIVPKNSTTAANNVSAADKDKAEIRTVRIVKRESEKRQRDKTKSRYDDNSFGMDDLTEEDQMATNNNTNGGYYGEDPIMDDPVLSQFSHILTLPRRNSKREVVTMAEKRPLSQRNSIAGNETDTRPLGPDQWRGSLRPRRNLSSLSLADRNNSTVSLEMSTESVESTEEGLGSLESTQRSPVLTPVYTSDAAREIVEEMRRQDMISARRTVPRHKRRHITISCSQPLVLEALTSSNTQRATQGRARDDVDLQRALRFHHPFAPDVVRSTITHAIRINEKTIDNILSAPEKIVIPERYVPEQEVEEVGEEEKQKRLKKTESIRRMLTDSAPVELPRPPSIAAANDTVELSEAKQLMAKERQQRDHFIGLNQMLVEEIKEKSKMAAASSLSMESQYAA